MSSCYGVAVGPPGGASYRRRKSRLMLKRPRMRSDGYWCCSEA